MQLKGQSVLFPRRTRTQHRPDSAEHAAIHSFTSSRRLQRPALCCFVALFRGASSPDPSTSGRGSARLGPGGGLGEGKGGGACRKDADEVGK